MSDRELRVLSSREEEELLQSYRLWTDEELSADLAHWRQALEDGQVRSDNRIDLLAKNLETVIALRQARNREAVEPASDQSIPTEIVDLLVNNERWMTRLAAAKMGLGHEVLAYDEDPDVRLAVAECGYFSENFVTDEDYRVRRAAQELQENPVPQHELKAEANHRSLNEILDRLARDSDPHVRAGLAQAGYALDVLAEDKEGFVAQAAKDYLAKTGLTLEEWAEKNPAWVVTSRPALPPRESLAARLSKSTASAEARNASRQGDHETKQSSRDQR